MRSAHFKSYVAPTVLVMLGLVVSPSLGTGDLDADGDVDLEDFAAFSACMNDPDIPLTRGCAQADFDDDGDVDLIDFANLQAAFTGDGVHPPLPHQTIKFDLIGIHDPGSDNYDGNCIGCHTDRTNEVALDGVTPASHSRMLETFGGGNEACIACHNGGPSFLNQSAANVRKQVNIEEVGCTVCHGSNTPLTSFYVR